MVSPAGESYKGFPALWRAHEESTEDVFRRLGYPYRDDMAIEIRPATVKEIEEHGYNP